MNIEYIDPVSGERVVVAWTEATRAQKVMWLDENKRNGVAVSPMLVAEIIGIELDLGEGRLQK